MLTSLDLKLLAVLDEQGGFTTGQVAELARISYSSHNKRQQSGAVRSWLMRLKEGGFVAFLDDQKPVCWKRTPQGTAALSEKP